MIKEKKLIDNLRFNVIPASGTKKAKILVIEPIDVSKHEELAEYFPDVELHIIDSDFELVVTDSGLEPGIKGKLNKIFSEYKYDYAIVYLNELFDENILRLARLKGIFSFATAIHNIDVNAATKYRTLVTNTPSFSSSAVAEQNIAFSLHSIFSSYLYPNDQSLKLSQVNLTSIQADSVAQLLWYCLLKHALRLDEMFEFGLSQYYVRLGVGEKSTVYHEQLGQGEFKKSSCSIGIIGLDSIGIRLVEISIAHEISTIYLVDEEVTNKKLSRLYEYIDLIKTVSLNKIDISVRIVPIRYLLDKSDYVVKTRCGHIASADPSKITIDYENIYISDRSVVDVSLRNHVFGVQGLGNIGYAAAQRYCSLSCSIRVFDPRQKEPSYINKIRNLKFLSKNTITTLAKSLSRKISIDFVPQNAIYKECDYIIFLNSSNYEGEHLTFANRYNEPIR